MGEAYSHVQESCERETFIKQMEHFRTLRPTLIHLVQNKTVLGDNDENPVSSPQ